MAFLELKAKDCSPLGQLILQHLEDNRMPMTDLADKAGITRPGLRSMCLKRSSPTRTSVEKLSPAIGVPIADLLRLVYRNKIVNSYKPDLIDLILMGFEDVLKALHHWAAEMPESERPSECALLDEAMRTVSNLHPSR